MAKLTELVTLDEPGPVEDHLRSNPLNGISNEAMAIIKGHHPPYTLSNVAVDWGANDCVQQIQLTWYAPYVPVSFSSYGYNAYTGNITVTGTASGTVTSASVITSANTDAYWGAWVGSAVDRGKIVTEEQRAEWRRMEAEQRRINDERQRVWAEEQRKATALTQTAQAKAEKLLIKYLTDEQRRTLRDNRYFDVRVNGSTYRLHYGTHGNVRLLDQAGRIELRSYCIQPDGVPAADAVLAQKLLLESNEQEFLRIANATNNPLPIRGMGLIQ